MADWNPRYLAYCAAHGRGPEEQLAHDAEEYPGGKMGGFLCWMNERWAEWRAARGLKRDAILSEADQQDFDAWLSGR